MARYMIRRGLQSLVLLLVITMAGFALYHIAPNSPFSDFENPEASKADAQVLAEKWGLNDPLPVQYGKWLWSVAHLDLGKSYFTREPVINLIAERLPATLILSLSGLILGLIIGVPLGVYAGLYRDSIFDQIVRVLTVAGNAVPHWWLGLVCLIFLGTQLGIVPLGGMYTLNKPFDVWDRLWHLALPAVITSMGGWLTYSRYLRSETIEVLSQDYVRTARAKGLGQSVVLFRHVLRNSLIPIATISAGTLAALISGAPLLEYTFSWPGMGRQTLEAAFKRDFPIMLGMLLILAALLQVGYLISDILYAVIDPRIRYD